jgi:hypothetical protein
MSESSAAPSWTRAGSDRSESAMASAWASRRRRSTSSRLADGVRVSASVATGAGGEEEAMGDATREGLAG